MNKIRYTKGIKIRNENLKRKNIVGLTLWIKDRFILMLVTTPFIHRSFTVHSPYIHRSFTVSCPYLARISPVSAPLVLFQKVSRRRS